MKRTTTLLSLLCAFTAIFMLIPAQFVCAEDPAAGSVFNLYNGFGTAAEYENFSFYVAPNGQSDLMVDGKADFTRLVRLVNVKNLGGWPSGTYYLSNEESSNTQANPSIEHFYSLNGQICTTVRQGYCNTIVFTAPTCGQYTYNTTIHTWDNGVNMEMSVKKPGAWEWGNAATVAGSNAAKPATDTVSLKKGETICFYFRNTDSYAQVYEAQKKTYGARRASYVRHISHTCVGSGKQNFL